MNAFRWRCRSCDAELRPGAATWIIFIGALALIPLLIIVTERVAEVWDLAKARKDLLFAAVMIPSIVLFCLPFWYWGRYKAK